MPDVGFLNRCCDVSHLPKSSLSLQRTGEKARRRDPRVSSYTGIACPDMKKDGVCVRGELCPYAHNVFEYWLHPTR